MKISKLIEILKKYPGDTRVLLWDKNNNAYIEPELNAEDLIAVTEFGAENRIHRPAFGDPKIQPFRQELIVLFEHFPYCHLWLFKNKDRYLRTKNAFPAVS